MDKRLIRETMDKTNDLRSKIAEGRHGVTLEDRKQYYESRLKMTFQQVDLLHGP